MQESQSNIIPFNPNWLFWGGRVSAWWAKGKSLSREAQPFPPSQEQNGENQPFSACFYFFLPLSETHFHLMMPLTHDSPHTNSVAAKITTECRAWVWLGKCTHTCHGCCQFNSELKKKRKRKKERQTDTFSNNAIPLTMPTHHTPSLSHTPQTHLFDASTPPKKSRIKNRYHVLHLSLMGMSSFH